MPGWEKPRHRAFMGRDSRSSGVTVSQVVRPDTQAAAKIDEIEKQREIGGEADGVGGGFTFLGQAEHLPHGLFMGKADDIMDRPAAGGTEIRARWDRSG